MPSSCGVRQRIFLRYSRRRKLCSRRFWQAMNNSRTLQRPVKHGRRFETNFVPNKTWSSSLAQKFSVRELVLWRSLLPALPDAPGLNIPQMFDAAKSSKLKALYVVGANPVGRLNVGPATLKDTFVVVQDMFLTETATLADVVLPAANAYEKSGTFTNTCGDVQMLKKAGEVTTTT